ncbi:MAG: hypothetical protein JNM27_05750 [Leptospirales bacterium]|nr:hypothetical protein [Leptospirales bacterium]
MREPELSANQTFSSGHSMESRPSSLIAKLLILACTISLSCLKLHVEPVLPVNEELVPPQANTSMQVVISGEDVSRRDFARAVTVSRVFSSRLTNETGSIEDLLNVAIAEAFRRKAIGICKSECNHKLEIHFDRFVFAWIPPREFIETPDPRYRGVVRIDLQIQTTIDGRTSPFTYARDVAALPGEESGILSLEIRRGLRAYVEWLMGRL